MPRRPGQRRLPFANYPLAAPLGQWIDRLPKPAVIAAGFGSLVLIAAVDYWFTSLQIHFLVVYLIPIFFLTWFAGWRAGLIASLVCGAANILIDTALAGQFPNPTGRFVSGMVAFPVYLITARVISAMRALVDHEQDLARTDYTTGAANRRAFFEALEVEIYRARRHSLPLTVVSIDLDNFKTVNDRYGHRTGDTLLAAAVEAMLNNTRATDMVARLGGDEFALLLPEAGPQAALAAVERMKNSLLAAMRRGQWPVTFSIGIATFLDPPDTPDELLKQADELMYTAKHARKGSIQQQVFSLK
jgi:diguanylate cyclase (GGDEF)-like protein